MSKKIYAGSWSANNGSSYYSDYAFTNLKKAKATMRAIALGNVFAGNSGTWRVKDSDDNVVAKGRVTVKNN